MRRKEVFMPAHVRLVMTHRLNGHITRRTHEKLNYSSDFGGVAFGAKRHCVSKFFPYAKF